MFRDLCYHVVGDGGETGGILVDVLQQEDEEIHLGTSIL